MYYVKNQVTDNNRNGHSNKTMSIGMGRIDIEVTDDRNGGSEPEIHPLRTLFYSSDALTTSTALLYCASIFSSSFST